MSTPGLKNWWHKKGVTFYTDVDRTHHPLCIVQIFFMDLLPFFFCSEFLFLNYIVTVPDPGQIGNLVSGPFDFLIEYPCCRPYNTSGQVRKLGGAFRHSLKLVQVLPTK